jgi:Ca-activated chloride channel family protein
MKSLVWILMLILGIGNSHQSENLVSVSGHVYSLQTGKHLSKVKVTSIQVGKTTWSDDSGFFNVETGGKGDTLIFERNGYIKRKVKIRDKFSLNVALTPGNERELIHEQEDKRNADEMISFQSVTHGSPKQKTYRNTSIEPFWPQGNTEEYSLIRENIFHQPEHQPLSTFSIDVDGAAYSNVRRFINNGQMPPKDAVRIEEMINYFHYDYPSPEGQHPFAIHTEFAKSPWNPAHQLVHIGIQGMRSEEDMLPPNNLVFLIDVSGSMSDKNKLPLVKQSLKLLCAGLNSYDKIAIVVYAGAAGLVLPPTSADQRERIFKAINQLEAGGSTAGGEGIELAYQVARENFEKNANNRVILATDGDFNIGKSSTGELVRMIEKERQQGIYLTITGFGMGNYKDHRMEMISNAGNGNYYYIDNYNEARKVFQTELSGTLFTIAKDVKIQVEFNPVTVQAYRLIGYENRKLNNEDFNDDKKDAGELGVGHSVTVLYEIIPVGIGSEFIKTVSDLKYQQKGEWSKQADQDILTMKLRYKMPDKDHSELIEHNLKKSALNESPGPDFLFSSAVAEFGMLLRESPYKSNASYQSVIDRSTLCLANDDEGFRQEFLTLVKNVQSFVR